MRMLTRFLSESMAVGSGIVLCPTSISSSLVKVAFGFPFMADFLLPLGIGSSFAGDENSSSIGSIPYSSRMPLSGTVKPVFL